MPEALHPRPEVVGAHHHLWVRSRLLATSYLRWVEVVSDLVEVLDENARAMVWSQNARGVYRLGQP